MSCDIRCKARFVIGGHTTDTLGLITYSSVVSRGCVRLAFLIARLNALDVLAGDVTNAYLNAKCRERSGSKEELKPVKTGSEFSDGQSNSDG
jgi:hypothetical protein